MNDKERVRQFRIVHRIFFNEKGVKRREHWIVEEWNKRRFVEKWRPVCHTVCYSSGCYKRVTEFVSLAEAIGVMQKIVGGEPIQAWTRRVVYESVANNE